ncbi:hypothetical protein D9M70_465620 [compost metagenome]
MRTALDDDDRAFGHMFPELVRCLGRVGEARQRGRFDLVEECQPATLQPIDGRRAVCLRPAVERPAGVERDGDVVGISPVEEAVIVRCQRIG